MFPALIRITASSKGIFGGSKTPSEANLNTMNNDKPRTVVISGVRIRNLAIDRTVLLLRVLLPALSICIPLKPFAIYDYIVRQMISSSDKLIIPSDFLSEAQNN
jgi:hypothetical protein